MEGFLELPPEEQTTRSAEVGVKYDALAKQVQKQVSDVLLPHQKRRLIDIFVELRGTEALMDAEVADQLGLTDRQQEQVARRV